MQMSINNVINGKADTVLFVIKKSNLIISTSKTKVQEKLLCSFSRKASF